MSKLIYLDSSDFSDLSKPEEALTPTDRSLLTKLRELKQTGAATFFISAIHFAEAIHAGDNHKEAAVRRALLMRELAGPNILRIPTDVLKIELQRLLADLHAPRLTINDLASPKGEFFGIKYDEPIANARANFKQRINSELAKFPRDKRRALKARLAKPALAKEILFPQLTTELPFPLSLLGRDTAVDWLVSNRPIGDLTARIISVLQDPYIFFDKLADATDQRKVIYKILRDTGRNIAESSRRTFEQLVSLAEADIKYGLKLDISKKLSRRLCEIDVERSALSAFTESAVDNLDDETIRSIAARAPAYSAYMHAIRKHMGALVNATISRAKLGIFDAPSRDESEFGDIMHIVYAPYFDVFRCDTYFGALLKQDPTIRHKIASKRADILRILDDPLAQSA